MTSEQEKRIETIAARTDPDIPFLIEMLTALKAERASLQSRLAAAIEAMEKLLEGGQPPYESRILTAAIKQAKGEEKP